MSSITENRQNNYKKLAAKRQMGLTVILENVHDPHNVGAVLRSCDSVGIQEIYVLYTHDNLDIRKFSIGKMASSGAWKYVEVNLFDDVEACFKVIKNKYDHVWATHLGSDSISMHEIDMTQSLALVFGNEHAGITKETLAHCTGNYAIPQKGITKSLNISVACAVSLYEVLRQREEANMYNGEYDENNPIHVARYDQYVKAHMDSLQNMKREKHHHIKKHPSTHFVPK